MHNGFDFLAHVVVLIANLNLCRTFSVFGIDLAHQVLQLPFAVFKLRAVVVTDDITQRRLFYGAIHTDQMVETFVSLGVLRCLETRQHDGYLVGDAHRVAHLMIRSTGVYVQAVYVDLACRGIKVFKLQLAYRAAIHGVGELCTELLYVKMVCAASDFFVRRESYADFSVFDFRVLNEVFHRRDDLCYTGFVVGAQKRCGIRHNDVLTSVPRVYVIAFFGFHDARLDVLAAGIRRSVHMRDETDYWCFSAVSRQCSHDISVGIE